LSLLLLLLLVVVVFVFRVPLPSLTSSVCSFVRSFVPILFVQIGRAKDPVKYYLAAEQRARERQVAYETVRLLREDVIECYRREGVNHYDNCRDVAARYYSQVTKKDLGQLQPDWKDPAKKDGW
jgi:hypothetical protein